MYEIENYISLIPTPWFWLSSFFYLSLLYVSLLYVNFLKGWLLVDTGLRWIYTAQVGGMCNSFSAQPIYI